MDLHFDTIRAAAGSAGGNPGAALPGPVRRIALVGNFPPRRCGLATFTCDSRTALLAHDPSLTIDVYAMNDPGNAYDYPAAVVAAIAQDDLASYEAAARQMAGDGVDLVWVQHEFGIFGGDGGAHLLRLVEQLDIPLLVTFHTVLEAPDPAQRHVVETLLRRAARVIVMAEAGARMLIRCYGASPLQIAVIPHGIPDTPFTAPDAMKRKLGLVGHDVILTFGLLCPDKGIETMIEALPAIVAASPRPICYVILGATHPHLLAREGEAYRGRLEALAERLGVEANIRWHNAYVDLDTLTDYLLAADIYVTPYVNPAQITSGTLSYAIGLGKAVVSTPYVHACELLAADHGRLVNFGDSAGFADEISALLNDPEMREQLRRRAYALGRTMIWPRYAEAVAGLFARIVRGRSAGSGSCAAPPAIPVPSFVPIERISDSTGIFQHSVFAVPDWNHGYCIDDNARALLLMNLNRTLPDSVHDRWAPVYAAFLNHAWNADAACFRNFMAFDRRWLEERGSEDSSARAVWAIGVTASDNRRPQLRHWAAGLFDRVAEHAARLEPPRSCAFVILGAVAMARARPGHPVATDLVRHRADRLLALVEANRRPDWSWFEIMLGYDNCRLPEALLRAGKLLGRHDLIEAGLETLRWIMAQQTAAAGHFRAVGTESFGRIHSPPRAFDQQPLEAWATIDACAAAFAVRGDECWRDAAMTAWRWFLGDNDLGVPLADPEAGTCFDGLTRDGPNLNQGAESLLAFHLSAVGMTRLYSHFGAHGALSPVAG